MILLGIDPGLSGAIAAVGGNGDWLQTYATPVLQTGKGNRRVYDVTAMAMLLHDLTRDCDRIGGTRAAIERQQAMPSSVGGRKQGTVSAFAQGYGYGLWLGLLAGLEIPHEILRPQAWQRAVGVVPKSGKAGSLTRASQLWPDAPLRGPRGGALDGVADALLIAEAGRRIHQGGKA